MLIWEIILLAVGLSMDAFAVSICKGLSCSGASHNSLKLRHCIICGLYFGGFQALMPLIGYFLGIQFASLINKFSHWIAFGLLLLIGANMIRESLDKKEEEVCDSFSVRSMIPLAIATSIDALAVGVTLALELDSSSVFLPVAIIGVITFIFSFCGVKIGNVFGAKYKSKAEFCGGAILILLGIKFLLSGLNIIHF